VIPNLDYVSEVSIPVTPEPVSRRAGGKEPDDSRPRLGNRVQGRYTGSDNPAAPVAVLFGPDPGVGGTMDNRVVVGLHRAFQKAKFAALRINFRSLALRSGHPVNDGAAEIRDATAASAYMQARHPAARECWVAGYSFGAWIALQLVIRRPELSGFVAVSPPVNLYDFTFLNPCPSSGLVVTGRADVTVPTRISREVIDPLVEQDDVDIQHRVIPRANHFYEDNLERMIGSVSWYLTRCRPAVTRGAG